MGQGYCLVKSVRRCPSPRKRQGLVLLWVSFIKGVLTAEASRMGVLWVSVMERVLTAEAATIGIALCQYEFRSKVHIYEIQEGP